MPTIQCLRLGLIPRSLHAVRLGSLVMECDCSVMAIQRAKALVQPLLMYLAQLNDKLPVLRATEGSSSKCLDRGIRLTSARNRGRIRAVFS